MTITVKQLREALARLPDDLPIMVGWELGYQHQHRMPERVVLFHGIGIYGDDHWSLRPRSLSTGGTLDAVIMS